MLFLNSQTTGTQGSKTLNFKILSDFQLLSERNLYCCPYLAQIKKIIQKLTEINSYW